MSNQIGLTRQQYEELVLGRMGQAGTQYPVPATTAAGELRSRGYDLHSTDLKGNERNPIAKMKSIAFRSETTGVVLPEGVGAAKWTAEAIDAAAAYLESRADFTPDTAFMGSCELTYADYLTALNKAWRETIDSFGSKALQVIPSADDVHFVLHVQQDRDGEGASVWFTLRDDVREQLEAE